MSKNVCFKLGMVTSSVNSQSPNEQQPDVVVQRKSNKGCWIAALIILGVIFFGIAGCAVLGWIFLAGVDDIPDSTAEDPIESLNEISESKTEISQIQLDEASLKDDSDDQIAQEKIVGFWKSLEPSEFDGTHLYTAYTEDKFLDVFEWIDYEVTEIEGNSLLYAWKLDTGNFAVDRKTLMEFQSDDQMRLKFDSFSDGIVYKRIPQSQWESEVEANDAAALERLRESLQRLADELAPSL